MNSKYTINGWTFEYCEGLDGYECRGMVCYDEEHDEVPERELWVAAEKLADRLSEDYPDGDTSSWAQCRPVPKPEAKEMTVEEISEALGHEVKVVK